MRGSHLSCGMGIPALSFIECRVFIPKSTFHAASPSSITYSNSPTFTRSWFPIPGRLSVNPASSLMPGGGVGEAVDTCSWNEWMGHSSVATSSSPWSVFKNTQHLQENTPSICSLPEDSTPGLKVWFWPAFWTQTLVQHPRVDIHEEEEEGENRKYRRMRLETAG